MNRQVIAGILFFVISTVIIHNVMPHHHHEDFPVHDHAVNRDLSSSQENRDHCPLTCQIQKLSYNVPRAQTYHDPLKLIDSPGQSLYCTGVAPVLSAGFSSTFICINTCTPVKNGVLACLPARAPPC